jgi:hypothetical protein
MSDTGPDKILSPLAAYDLSMAHKARLEREHFRTVESLYRRAAATRGGDGANGAFFAAVARQLRLRPDTPLPKSIRAGYRDLALKLGLRRVDPGSANFEADLDRFFCHYQCNFPIRSEQESLEGFRRVLTRPPTETGYEERCYSVICPLTGAYLMGLDFTIQPRSDSVHFIYGFAMPPVRGGWGFGGAMLALMRDAAREAMASYFRTPHASNMPSYRDPSGPLIVFEKNRLRDMTLTDILLDSAGIDIFDPPTAKRDLSASGTGQSLRDLAWDRLGGKIVRYTYLQPGLEGCVVVPATDRNDVVRLLTGQPLARETARIAETALRSAIGARAPGCTTLDLCVFASPGGTTVLANQIRDSVRIFQANSVAKDGEIETDIYFQAQSRSLADHTVDGALRLDRIEPFGAGTTDFVAAEDLTRRILSLQTWDTLCDAADRRYEDWAIALVERARPG